MPPQHRNYPKPVERKKFIPPHVTLAALRRAVGLTHDEVIARMKAAHPGEFEKLKRGTLSAIESGTRGASPRMLAAMVAAYGLVDGDEITTSYVPRPRKVAAIAQDAA